MNYQKPMFSDDDERRPLMTEEELRDACLHVAATIVVAVALGCEFEDCRLNDDGYKWPTSISRVDLKYPKGWSGKEALSSVATIHEVGAMAVAKRHERGGHLINRRIDKGGGRELLDLPLVWKTVEALAQFIRDNYEGDGCYGAMGTDYAEVCGGEDSEALKLIKDMLIGDMASKADEPVQ